MTTIVTRSDPRTTTLNEPEPALHEAPGRAGIGAPRVSTGRVGSPLLAPAGVIHMAPSHATGATRAAQPPVGAGFAGMFDHLVGTIRSVAGYSATANGAVAASTSSTPRTDVAKTSTTARSATATKAAVTKSATSSRTTTARELAFLSDKNLSIEEKLYRFIALMTKKGDQELVDAMKSYQTKKSAASKSSSSSKSAAASPAAPTSTAPTITAASSPRTAPAAPPASGGGGGGLFGSIFGGIGDALGDVASFAAGGLGTLLEDAGGPILAAATTAVGFPELAPLAMSAGKALGGLIANETTAKPKSSSGSSGSASLAASATAGKTSSSATTRKTSNSGSSSRTSDSGDFDERLEMMNLQRLVEKQDAMFSALSNVMRAVHEAQMSAVQNIR